MSVLSARSLMAGGAVLVTSQAIQAGVAFAANLVLIVFIGPEDFGRFALVVAATSLVLSVVSLRINTLVMRISDEALTRPVRERYFTILSIETVIAAVLGVAWISTAGPTTGWALVLVLVLCARHWVDQNKAFFERQMLYVRLGILESGIAISAHALSVLLVVLGFGPDALYWRELFWLAAMLIGLRAVGGLTVLPLRRVTRDEWRRTLREARGIWIDSVLEGAYQRILVQVAGLVGGERGAGFFFQAHRLAMSPHLLFAPLGNRIGVNWLRRAEDQAHRRQGRFRLLMLMTLILAPLAALTWLFADPVLPAVFGQAWAPAAAPLRLMAGVVLFLTLFEVLRAYCTVVGRMKLLFAGRITQYAATAAAFGYVVLSGRSPSIETLATGVSLGYAIPFGLVLLLLWIVERGAARERS